MTDNPKTCVDPYLESFAQSFAAANYTAGTIRTYRHLTRKLGRLMDTAGIVPSALSPALADQLARTPARGPDNRIRFHNLARRFAEHLVDIGVAEFLCTRMIRPRIHLLIATTTVLATL